MAYNDAEKSALERKIIDEIVSTVIKNRFGNTLLGQVGVGQTIPNHRYAWLNRVLSPRYSTLTTGVDADDTTLVLADNSRLPIGTVIQADGSRELMLVVAKPNGTNTTVTRSYKGTTGEAVSSGKLIRFHSNPKIKGSTQGDDDIILPYEDYNFTQIFRRDFPISRSDQQSTNYGIADFIAEAVTQLSEELLQELAYVLVHGVRADRAEGGGDGRGMMGGVMSYVNVSGGNVIDASAAAISKTLINNLILAIIDDGGIPDALYCPLNQARKFSGFDSNPVVQATDTVTNRVVLTYQPDIPGVSALPILTDPDMPTDSIAIFDRSRIKIHYQQPLIVVDSTSPKDDGFSRKLVMEATCSVKNGKEAHGVIHNLAA